MATILIVDDRPSNRQFMSTLLGYAGHRLLEAGDGVQALDMMEKSHTDLLVTDIVMPSMDGLDLVREMRERPAMAGTPVIFWTATYSVPEAQRLALSCGVDAVLPKPCEPELILDAVNKALGVGAGGPRPAPAPAPPPAARSANGTAIDDSVTLYLKDLQAVQAKFDDIAKRGASLGAERARIRDLSKQFSTNVTRLQSISSKLSALIEVGMEMTSERDPERLVNLFFAATQDIVPSAYAGAGVLDEKESGLRYVLAKGVDRALLSAAGSPATAQGHFRALLEGHAPIRERGARALRAAGLPATHPPVANFLGVAIASPERVYGWLYLADRKGAREFSEEDERLAKVMATKLALLYEHSMLYDVIQRHAARLQIESTERRRAEGALRESEGGLRRAQSLAKLAHVISHQDGTFEKWSDTMPVLAGLAPEAMPTTTRAWLEHVLPEDRDLVRRASVEAGATGERRELEYRLRRADGEIVHIHQVIDPIVESKDARGGRRWFNTLQDVSLQRRTAETLRRTETRFRTIFENSVEGIFQTSAAGGVLTANAAAARMLGYDSPEAVIAEVNDLAAQVYADPDDRKRLYDLLAQHGYVRDHETRFRRKGGGEFWVSISARIMRDERDGVTLLGMIQDITERRAAADRIRRLNRVYAVLSGINTLIVRARNREELFREACRIAVDAGGFRLAWIGMVDREAEIVHLASWSGDGDNYVEHMPLGLGDAGGAERGLTGLAVAERRAILSEDVINDPRILLREEARTRGFRALAVLPLMVSGEPIGVLSLYAGEANFFDDEEMKLLVELAGDIAFAIRHIDILGKVEYLALHDPLTGLPNRAVLINNLEMMMRSAQRDDLRAAVVFLNIERFRLFNESLGRQGGDELLTKVADRIHSTLRAGDSTARVGGDTFAVAVAPFANVGDVTHLLADRFARAFAAPFEIAGREMRVVLKAGAAVYPDDGVTAEILSANAEAALMSAKESAERFAFYKPELNARMAESLALETRLRNALEADQFVLYYQPKVDVRTRRLLGLEALIRWRDPELGLVPPGKFIPLMEETGLILQVGPWALRRAVADCLAWRARGLRAPRVAVNVSPLQLRQKDFVDSVLKALEGFGGGEPLLDLEITESMVMQNLASTVRALQTLRGVGVETSLDDFGTGYSSLAYVAKLPVIALKIDRSFIIEMATSDFARTIVQTVISLAHSLKLQVVAEGVDREDQVEILAALGCDQMQGYLVSRPIPAEEIAAFLDKA